MEAGAGDRIHRTGVRYHDSVPFISRSVIFMTKLNAVPCA